MSIASSMPSATEPHSILPMPVDAHGLVFVPGGSKGVIVPLAARTKLWRAPLVSV